MRGAGPARRPFSDGVIPTVFDRTLCPEGYHNVALYAVGPARMVRGAPQGRARGVRGPCDRRLRRAGAEPEGAILHRQVLSPTTWSRISGSSGATSSTASSRPSSSSTCGRPRLRRLPDPHPGPLPGLVGHPRRWRVCAIPAYNCVREIRRDRRRERLKERLTLRNRG